MKNIKILVLDVDGTLTDGTIYISEHGEFIKGFNAKDGYGICKILPEYNITPIIITARISKIVENRCKELGIKEVYQGCKDKKSILLKIAEKYNLKITENGIIEKCAYIGDDIVDIEAMKMAELTACPMDAVDEVKDIVKYTCCKKGGHGAVREFIDWIVK